jgi:MFS family permease
MSGILKPEITAIAIKNGWDPVKLLSIFSGTYFYTYALAQLIVGPIVDSLGVRRAGFIFLLVMTFGTLMMSVDDAWVLVIGRLLVGFAASVAYLSFHRASSYYYPKESQGLLTAVAIVVGNTGSLASTYPLRTNASQSRDEVNDDFLRGNNATDSYNAVQNRYTRFARSVQN